MNNKLTFGQLRYILYFLILIIGISCTKNSEKDATNLIENNTHKLVKSSETFSYDYKFGRIDTVGEKTSEKSYDSSGNVILWSRYWFGDSTISWQDKYRYDEFDNLIVELGYNEEGQLAEKTFYYYDSIGRTSMIKSIPTDAAYDGEPSYEARKEIYEYDDIGNLKYIKEYLDDRVITIDKFIYDAFGNKIKETHISKHFFPEIPEKITKEKRYVYNKDGLLLEASYNQLDWHIVEKFDENCNEIERYRYNEDGSLESNSISTYDNENNIIQIIIYDKTGEPKSQVKVYYKYY